MEKICEICGQKDCGYINREMEYKCQRVQDYQLGFDDALSKACEWLKGEMFEEDIDGENYVCSSTADNIDEFINNFKKAMEE